MHGVPVFVEILVRKIVLILVLYFFDALQDGGISPCIERVSANQSLRKVQCAVYSADYALAFSADSFSMLSHQRTYWRKSGPSRKCVIAKVENSANF